MHATEQQAADAWNDEKIISQPHIAELITKARPTHDCVGFDGEKLFFAQKNMLGGPAPVRRFLPDLMKLVLERKIDPGKVFDLQLPLADVAEGYRAMDERRAIKTMLRIDET